MLITDIGLIGNTINKKSDLLFSHYVFSSNKIFKFQITLVIDYDKYYTL